MPSTASAASIVVNSIAHQPKSPLAGRVWAGLLRIAHPPDKAQCIMHGRQEPDWISEALRQVRYGSPLISHESPDVIAGKSLVGFSVANI